MKFMSEQHICQYYSIRWKWEVGIFVALSKPNQRKNKDILCNSEDANMDKLYSWIFPFFATYLDFFKFSFFFFLFFCVQWKIVVDTLRFIFLLWFEIIVLQAMKCRRMLLESPKNQVWYATLKSEKRIDISFKKPNGHGLADLMYRDISPKKFLSNNVSKYIYKRGLNPVSINWWDNKGRLEGLREDDNVVLWQRPFMLLMTSKSLVLALWQS